MCVPAVDLEKNQSVKLRSILFTFCSVKDIYNLITYDQICNKLDEYLGKSIFIYSHYYLKVDATVTIVS